jgi:hypothetical protein
MPHNWDSLKNYNDFETNLTTSYGSYLFDSNPFVRYDYLPGKYMVQKATDGKNGGWHLYNIDVYVYWPARNFKYENCAADADDCASHLAQDLYYDHYKFDDYLQQGGASSNNNKLTTKERAFDALSVWDEDILDEMTFKRIGTWL